jgi:hypothetical protein
MSRIGMTFRYQVSKSATTGERASWSESVYPSEIHKWNVYVRYGMRMMKFLGDFEIAHETFAPWWISNCDETIVRPEQTRNIVRRLLRPSVPQDKSCLYRLCAQDRYLDWEQRARIALNKELDTDEIEATHQTNGWCDQDVAIEYLRLDRRVGPGGWLLFIFDVYRTHRNVKVKEESERQNIELLDFFINMAKFRYSPNHNRQSPSKHKFFFPIQKNQDI